MESALDWHSARALLEWQLEMGVDEAISDTPVDRYAVEVEAKKPKAEQPAKAAKQQPVSIPDVDPVEEANVAANGAADLDALQRAMEAYEHCTLKRGARNLVFSGGTRGAKVMIIGEAPGREEDLQNKPFVGAAGQLLDKMLAAIDLSRDENVYIANVLPWRPPQNRDPKAEEIAMLVPFLKRHIALAKPDVLVLFGDITCQALMGKRGIARLRGTWSEVEGRPALPMFHPSYLLRNTAAKRDAWADLLALKAKLKGH